MPVKILVEKKRAKARHHFGSSLGSFALLVFTLLLIEFRPFCEEKLIAALDCYQKGKTRRGRCG